MPATTPPSRRWPLSWIRLTAHDGFTLADLVSYGEKHNDANLEGNKDGENNNLSWNCGVEGPTDDPAIQELRCRQMRNVMATLLLSQGVPMISHGDELLRTQQGNNNAYCQDNELTWIDWDPTPEKQAMLEFVAQVIHVRLAQPVLRRRKYFQGRSIRGGGVKDVAWLAPDGREMTDEAWSSDFVRSLGMLLSGNAIEEGDERGEPITGDTLLVLLNAHSDRVPFTLPPLEPDQQWQRVFDTIDGRPHERVFRSGARYPLRGRSMAVFKVVPPRRERRRAAGASQADTEAGAASPVEPAERVPVGSES